MTISSQTSLAPSDLVVETTLKDAIHTSLVASLPDKNKIYITPEFVKNIFDLFLHPNRQFMKELNTGKGKLDRAIGFPFFTKLPCHIENIASLISSTSEVVFALKKQVDRLTPEERHAVMRQLPLTWFKSDGSLREILNDSLNDKLATLFSYFLGGMGSNTSDPSRQGIVAPIARLLLSEIANEKGSLPTTLRIASGVADGIITLNKKKKRFCQEGVEAVVSTLSHISEPVISLSTQKSIQNFYEQTQLNMQKCWALFSGDMEKLGTQLFMSKIMERAQKEVGKGDSIEHALTLLMSNFCLVEETLNKIEGVLTLLPPIKMITAVFNSLEKFSLIVIEADKSFAENSFIAPDAQAEFQLYSTASRSLFPISDMNDAFRLLCDPKGYEQPLKNRYLKLLKKGIKQAHPDAYLLDQVAKDFKSFCIANHFQDQPEGSLELIKVAFYAKHLSLWTRGAGCRFLANMLLLTPQDYVHGEQITLEDLIRNATILYIKKYMYPTIVKQLLPSDFNELISALSKITGIDIADRLSTSIANSLIKNGLDFFKNPHTLPKIVVQTLGGDTSRFADYSIGNGSDGEINLNFETLLKSFGTPHYADALEALSLKKSEKSQKQLGEEALIEVDRLMGDKVEGLSFLLQTVVGKPGRALGKEVAALSQRKDWGIFMLILFDHLNHAFQDPVSAPTLSLLDRSLLQRLEHISTILFPSTACVLHTAINWLPKFLITSTLQNYQEILEGMSYDNYVQSLEVNLEVNHLAKRFVRGLEFHSSAPFPAITDKSLLQAGITQALSLHIQGMVQFIWGIEPNSPHLVKYTKEYLHFLAQQKTDQLVETIKMATLHPRSIQKQFMHQKEEALTCTVLKLDEVLLNPYSLPPIKQLSLTYIEQRLKELEALSLELEKTQKAIADPHDMTHSLGELLGKVDHLLPQIQAGKKEKEQLVSMRELLNLHLQMTELQTSLSLIYRQEMNKASIQEVIIEQERNLKRLNTQIDHLEESSKFNKQKNPETLEESRELEELQARFQLQQKNLTNLIKDLQHKETQMRELTDKFNANPFFEELITQKKKLFDLLSEQIAENNPVVIELKKTILKLENNIKREWRKLNQKECEIYGSNLSPSIKNKMEHFNMMLQEALLRDNPEQNKGSLAHLHKKMAYSYERILKFEFGIGLGLMTEEKMLIHLHLLGNSISVASSQVELTILMIHQQIEAILIQQRDLSVQRRQLSRKWEKYVSKKEVTEKIGVECAALELGLEMQKSLTEHVQKKKLLEDSLALKEKEKQHHVQSQESSLNTISWVLRHAKKLLIEEDLHVIVIDREISALEEEIEFIENQITDCQLIIKNRPSVAFLVSYLEKHLGETELSRIKACYEARVSQQKRKKDQLINQEKEIDEAEKGLEIELRELTNTKQKKVNQNSELLQQINEINDQIGCIKYLAFLSKPLDFSVDRSSFSAIHPTLTTRSVLEEKEKKGTKTSSHKVFNHFSRLSKKIKRSRLIA